MEAPALTPARASAALLPRSLDDAIKLAQLLAESDLVPREYRGKPGNVLVALQYGMELGLHPMQAVQSIAVLNGRPCVWGDAVVMASGLLEDIDEQYVRDGNGPEQVYATCAVKRRGLERFIVRRFSWADAVRAGLAGKDNYKAYPQRMLQMRARAWALRDAFPDVLKGLQIREEVEDYRIVESAEPTVATNGAAGDDLMPRRRVVAEPAAATPDTAEPEPSVPEPTGPVADDEALAAMLGEQSPAPEPTPTPSPAESAPPDDSAERGRWLGRIDKLVADRKVKAPVVAGFWRTHAPQGRDQATLAELQALYAALDKATAAAPAAPTGQGVLTFTIGPKTYQTRGITKSQLLEAFKLSEQVGSDLAKAVLVKEFGVASRTDLTHAQADRYLIRLREVLEG